MSNENFLAAAEMFSNVRKVGWSRTPVKYRRFENLALAVKFAVEDMDGTLQSITIRTEDDDLTGPAIQSLYDSASFPLARK
jgi:hypothetical protein